MPKALDCITAMRQVAGLELHGRHLAPALGLRQPEDVAVEATAASKSFVATVMKSVPVISEVVKTSLLGSWISH